MSTLAFARAAHAASAGVAEMLASPALVFGQRTLRRARVELSVERDAGPTYDDAEHRLVIAQGAIESRSEVALPAGPTSIHAPDQRTD